MKKVQILIITLLVGSVALVSFKKTKMSTRYGGTASVTVKVVAVGSGDLGCWSRWVNSDTKAGDTRTIEVETSCSNYSSSDAKSKLLSLIKDETECYERLAGSIDYDIDTCD